MGRPFRPRDGFCPPQRHDPSRACPPVRQWRKLPLPDAPPGSPFAVPSPSRPRPAPSRPDPAPSARPRSPQTRNFRHFGCPARLSSGFLGLETRNPSRREKRHAKWRKFRHRRGPAEPPAAHPETAPHQEPRPTNDKGPGDNRRALVKSVCLSAADYIIPDMSGMPPPPPPSPSFSGTSATIASVVRMFLAIDAAFWSAERVTMAGSMMPSLTRSTISPLAAFRPWPFFALRTSLTTTEPSRPAFSAI